jgi:hypothetical protein
MTIIETIRDLQVTQKLSTTTLTANAINSCSICSSTESYTFGKSGNDIAKGVPCNTDVLSDNTVVDRVNQNTLRFQTKGLYLISFTCNSYISDTNAVAGLIIRFATDDSLVNEDEFSDFATTGIKSFQANVQISTDADKRSTHAVQSHYFSYYHRYTGTNPLFKVFVFGPNEAVSFLESGFTLVITYMGDK